MKLKHKVRNWVLNRWVRYMTVTRGRAIAKCTCVGYNGDDYELYLPPGPDDFGRRVLLVRVTDEGEIAVYGDTGQAAGPSYVVTHRILNLNGPTFTPPPVDIEDKAKWARIEKARHKDVQRWLVENYALDRIMRFAIDKDLGTVYRPLPTRGVAKC